MADVDHWLKTSGRRMLFVYGENEPWSAEKFEAGPGTRDSHWYTVPNGNHGSTIGALPTAQRVEATGILQKWMGVPVNTSLQTLAVDPGAQRISAR